MTASSIPTPTDGRPAASAAAASPGGDTRLGASAALVAAPPTTGTTVTTPTAPALAGAPSATSPAGPSVGPRGPATPISAPARPAPMNPPVPCTGHVPPPAARGRRARGDDRGQATAEYGLVILVAGLIALGVIAWVRDSSVFTDLFGGIIETLTSSV